MVEFRAPVFDEQYHRRRAYKSVYAEIAEKPGQWGVLAKYQGSLDPDVDQKARKAADVRASDLRCGKVKVANQLGDWEATVQRNKETGDWELFARVVRGRYER